MPRPRSRGPPRGVQRNMAASGLPSGSPLAHAAAAARGATSEEHARKLVEFHHQLSCPGNRLT
eukprot:1126070-Prorocentrum_lima.AAC.1